MSQLRDRKILVLGATGMVAGPVVRALAEHNEVWGAARFTNPQAKADLETHGVRTVVLDLSDPDLTPLPKDVDYVINLAVTHPRSFAKALATNAESLGLVM